MLKSVGVLPFGAVRLADGINIMRTAHMRQAHI